MKKKIIVFILCLIPLAAHGQNYLWPTDASHYLTSTFGEYRARHFHSALDIKTWNRIGYKVYAVDDGYIWRIRTSNTGYGKVLYEKLKDGNIAVYAHLDHFQAPIEKFMEQLQDKQGEYEQDYFPTPSQYRVKRGEVIAYTGNTGTLYAHLHFEIRNARNEPLNPLTVGYSVKDHVAPVPQGVAVSPLSVHSTVNGNYFKQVLSVTPVGNHTYRTSPVTVSGPFGLEIRAYDGVNDVPNKYSIYSAELSWQDSVVFRFRYNRFRFNQTNLIMLERDYGLERYGYGRYQRLYKTSYTKSLPFYSDGLDGRIELPAGSHTLRLVLKDYNGNSAIVLIPVTASPEKPAVQWDQSPSGDVTCKILPADSTYLSHLHIKKVLSDGIKQSIIPAGVHQQGEGLYLTLPPIGTNAVAYTMQFGSPEPVSGNIYAFTSRPNQDFNPQMDWIYSPQGMIATLTNPEPVYRPLSLEIITSQSDTLIPLYSHDLKQWNTPPIPAAILNNAVLFISSESDVLTFFPRTYTVAHPATESILADPDNQVELRMDASSLFYPAVVWLQDNPAPSGNYFSPIWTFAPRTIPFRNSAELRVSLPDVSFPKRQLGIYFTSNSHTWRYLPAEFSADSTVLTGDIYSLEAFTLRRDSIPPRIRLLSPKPGGTYTTSRLKKLTYKITDGQSTVPNEDGIELFLDGKPAIFAYNPNTDVVTYRLRSSLSPGGHAVRIVARDAAGNTSRRTYQFTIR